MLTERMKKLIYEIPKGENHIHIEGSIPPEVAIRLAKKNGVDLPWETAEELAAHLRKPFASLDAFMESDRLVNSVCQTEEDYAEVLYALAKQAKDQNIIYTEYLLDYPLNEVRGISLETVVNGYEAGRQKAMKELGVDIVFIAGIDRSLSSEMSLKFIQDIEPYKDIIPAIGMDCEENGHPCIKHKAAYDLAKEMGLYLSAHAGEDPHAGDMAVQNVWDAVDKMGCVRIEHGVLSIRDEALMKHLAEKKILLTTCPTSNCPHVFPTLEEHPLKFLMEQGIPCSINSDDPPYVGDLIETMLKTADALDLTEDDIIELERNSLLYSIRGQHHLKEFDAWVEQWKASAR